MLCPPNSPGKIAEGVRWGISSLVTGLLSSLIRYYTWRLAKIVDPQARTSRQVSVASTG